MASIKITALTDIGANIRYNTLVPVVDMSGTPVTDKANLQIIGNLILSQAGGANFVPINISAHTSNSQILFSNSGVITGNANLTFNSTTGILTTPGNVTSLGSRLSLGANAASIPLLSPTLVATASNPTYVQASLFNEASTGSADFIAYGAQGNDSEGWNDMGFTGETFNDPAFSVTQPGDGYIFCQTYSGNNFSGNLIIATGENGTAGDIIFATKGFTANKSKARVTGVGKLLVGYDTSQDASIIQANGGITANGIKTPSISSTSSVDILTGGATSGGWNFSTNGNLTWPSPSGDWHIGADATTSAFEIYSSTGVVVAIPGQAYLEFEFNPDGTFHSPGNVFIGGEKLTVGPGADNIPLNGPVIVAGSNNPTFVQTCVYNFNPAGSADVTTNGTNATDVEGWTDMGFTGPSFNDPNFTITGAGDGYLFVQTYANGALGGNLVLATGTNSTVGDIIFATGGFTSGLDKARVTKAGKLLVGKSASTDSSIIQANGNISANSAVLSGVVKTGVFTTSTIPAAATAGAGARAFVTDATSATFAAAYVGGAANAVPVYSDGSAWYIG